MGQVLDFIVELLYTSLEEILRVMGAWFTPEEIGFSPVYL